MNKKVVGLFCGAVAVLGASGIIMGLGYLWNKRTKLEHETPAFHEAMTKRESKTGWASIAAGIGVMISSIPLYNIITGITDQLSSIKSALNGR